MTRITSDMLDGRYLIKKADEAHLVTKHGKGDHVVIVAPVGRGYIACPARAIGKGLACEIVKWLVKAGVVFSVFSILTALYVFGG